jgi:predicted nucleic acid-binding protein
MKKSVYIDTTIPSYYFDERNSISFQNQITKNWFSEESQNYDIFISEAVLIELQAGSYPNKKEILNFTSQFEILNNNNEINKIAEIYIQNYLMPKDFEGDALHLAFTSFYKIDFLLTWNCNHLANANKKQHIRIINSRLNLMIPEIITPLELFTETLKKEE